MTRTALLAVVLLCLQAAPAWAQPGGRSGRNASPPSPLVPGAEPTYKQITVRVIEFSGSLSEDQASELNSVDDLTALLEELAKAGSIKQVRCFAIRAMEHVVTSAQYGGVASLPEAPQESTGRPNSPLTSRGSNNTDRYARFAEALLKQSDKNGNGVLEKEEWENLRMAQGADASNDGVITAAELTAKIMGSVTDSGGPRIAGRQADIGTMIKLQWATHEEKFIVEVAFEQTQVEPAADAPAAVATISIGTTVGVKPGQTVLIANNANGQSTRFLTLQVTSHE